VMAPVGGARIGFQPTVGARGCDNQCEALCRLGDR
jgi:hypothetical protein